MKAIHSLFDKYSVGKICDDILPVSAELYGIAFTWVEWLEYNIRRALGIDSTTDEEVKLGEAETINTIDRIRYIISIEKDICGVLKENPTP